MQRYTIGEPERRIVERAAERIDDAAEQLRTNRNGDRALPGDDTVAGADPGKLPERHREQGAVTEADDLRRQDGVTADDLAHLAEAGARAFRFDQQPDDAQH